MSKKSSTFAVNLESNRKSIFNILAIMNNSQITFIYKQQNYTIMKKSEKDLKKNCILISEFRKCGFLVSDITCFYKSATYIGLFKYHNKFLVFTRVLTNNLYEYNNWKDAYTHFTNLINDVK